MTGRIGKPLILSFVSGKGGVGKTMLAVSAANELAHVCPTLVIDLDFFNRGLSGMFVEKGKFADIEPPAFLDHGNPDEWYSKRISDNLYTISFPDVMGVANEMTDSGRIPDLAGALRNWIEEICKALECEAVVLDCHGGPDNLSFASVEISDKCIIVSEPDRVTMYGTLHFLRKVEQQDISLDDLHLVYNKVVDSVGAMFLWRSYDTHLKHYFGKKPLLAAFPLEIYLTKSFENDPLVSENYPGSMLARKTQVMLFDLFKGDRKKFLSRRAATVPPLFRYFRRRFFWRTPKIFSVEFLAALGFALLLLITGLTWLLKDTDFVDWALLQLNSEFTKIAIRGQFKAAFEKTVTVWAAFAATALMLSWTRFLDRQATLYGVKRQFVRGALYLSTMVVLWGVVGYLVLLLLFEEYDGGRDLSFMTIVCLLALSLAVGIWIRQGYRAVRDVKYSNRRIVGMARGVCAFLILGGLGISAALRLPLR